MSALRFALLALGAAGATLLAFEAGRRRENARLSRIMDNAERLRDIRPSAIGSAMPTGADGVSFQEASRESIDPAGPQPWSFPGYEPVVWRGMTSVDPYSPMAGLGFMTFDGRFHQLLLSDLDLVGLGRAIVAAFPRRDFGPGDHHGTSLHSPIERGSLQSAGLSPDDVILQSPDSSFSKTSAGS